MDNYIVIYFDLLEGSVTPRRRQAYFVNMAVGNDSKKTKGIMGETSTCPVKESFTFVLHMS